MLFRHRKQMQSFIDTMLKNTINFYFQSFYALIISAANKMW